MWQTLGKVTYAQNDLADSKKGSQKNSYRFMKPM